MDLPFYSKVYQTYLYYKEKHHLKYWFTITIATFIINTKIMIVTQKFINDTKRFKKKLLLETNLPMLLFLLIYLSLNFKSFIVLSNIYSKGLNKGQREVGDSLHLS